MARIHRRTVQKDLHDQDNHDAVITHLEPDMLECEVKWALESITMNKASGGDGLPVELFQILKDDAVKVLHSICKQTNSESMHTPYPGGFFYQTSTSRTLSPALNAMGLGVRLLAFVCAATTKLI